jgi:hypothetical protein
MQIPRTRGAISGLLIAVLGAWGAIVPFIGPSFNLTIGPDATFHMTDGRLWLSLIPGVVAVVGGLLVLLSANRASAILGAQLALAAGVWFVIGPVISQLWSDAPGALGQAGFAAGNESRRVLEAIAYFFGVGAAIIAFAGIALGRLTLRTARDVEVATAATAADRPARPVRTGRFDRERPPVADPEPERERELDREPASVGAPATAPAATERTTPAPAPATTTTRGTRRSGGLVGRFRRS